ncbi:hypothetical protein PS682_05506 [Pseudomonas fluorescens]|nr:hypothetical protein PS682_05506 [Pseudomonas fluorescens]
MTFIALGVLQHLLEHHHILQAVDHPGIRRQTITAGTPGFLVVRLEGLGQVHVRDEAHVGLVDAHAERNGGHHDQAFLVEEALLVSRTRFVGQAGVIRQRRVALLAQERRHFVDLLARQAIDNPRIAAPLGEERQQLLARLLLGHDAVENVRPVETRQEALGVLQMQALDDFFAGALVGSGRQSDARHIGKQLRQLAKLQIFAAEIMAPLRYAVGFIDGEQGDFQALQKGQHARLHQALGGQVEHLHFTALDPRSQVALLLGTEGGVQGRRSNTEFFEGRDLVVHQRDQRRHHHGQAVAQQRRHLEAQ